MSWGGIMSWMIPAIASISCATFVLFFIFMYLYAVEKKNYMGILAGSWGVYLISTLLILLTFAIGDLRYNVGIDQALSILSSYLLVKGSALYFKKNMGKTYKILFLFNGIWAIISIFINVSDMAIILPGVISLSIIYIQFGRFILKKSNNYVFPTKILAYCFIIWGFHKMDYPFLRNVEWFAPWGYIISSFLELLLAFNFFLIYFENIRGELLKAHKTLKKSENRLSSIIKNQRDIIFELDRDMKFTFLSPSCKEVLGINKEELLGKYFYDIIKTDVKINLFDNNNGDFSIENTWRISNGEKYLSINCKSKFDFMGQFNGTFGSIRDITNRKLLEEAIEYDKYRTEFFANISHELRTPINVILSTLQVMDIHLKSKMDGIDNKMNRYMEAMRNNSYRLIRLFNNIIDMTKMDCGYVDLNIKNYNIVALIEDTFLSVSSYLESKNLSFEFDTDTEEKIIACDGEKIERVVLNLLSNAVKFTEPGGSIKINVEDKGETVIFSIKDSGMGIPKR